MEKGRRARFKSDIRIKPETRVRLDAETRRCAIANCSQPASFRVPKSRDNLTDYMWCCLEHARAHNESWDFFKGMDDAAIERFRDDAILGHRPTWPLGRRTAKARMGQAPLGVDDGHALFGEDGETQTVRRPERQLSRLQIIAMDTLQLAHNATLNEIKARYKELVKRFHPDANGGDRGAEERLKQVIKAYGVLRASGLT
jgi:DnaJ domain